MKTHILIITVLLIVLPSSVFSQAKIKVKNEQVFVNEQHCFDIVSVGMGQEIIVKDKNGSVVYNLIFMKIATGYSTTTRTDSKGRFSSDSGTNYTYYYKMNDANGNQCEIAYVGLQSKKGIAKYLMDNNLIRDGIADPDEFLKFCSMRGFIYSGGR